MVGRKYLFIEGTKDTTNGNLREGFSKLLEKKVKGKMPTISMGDGKEQTIRKFKNTIDSKLLCDLDASSSEREKDLKAHNIFDRKQSVFYMIQEMEGWFISQPEILNEFYNATISNRLAKKDGAAFAEPDKELQRVTKDTKKGTYHKVNHGVQLLKLLDTDKLSVNFPDFKALIDELAK